MHEDGTITALVRYPRAACWPEHVILRTAYLDVLKAYGHQIAGDDDLVPVRKTFGVTEATITFEMRRYSRHALEAIMDGAMEW